MAIDPRIPLAARGNQFAERFQTGQINAGNLLAQSQATQQSAQAFPLLQQGRQQNLEIGQQNLDAGEVAKAMKAGQVGLQFLQGLQSIPAAQRPAAINSAIQDGTLIAAGIPEATLRGIDTSDEGVVRKIAENQAFNQQLQQQLTAGQREFQSLVATANLSPEDKVTAARRALFLDAKPVGSSALTIADEGRSQDVATSQANIAGQVSGAQTRAKLGEELTTKPLIEAAVTTAKGEAALESQQKAETQKINVKRIGELNQSSRARASSTRKARQFLRALEKGEAHSGATRKALSFTPGVFTDQAQFDEKFNAFAEVAARQKLKASGELRPTDADVEGMKRAIFGVGRDEQTNIELLQEFIEDQQNLDDELEDLSSAKESGTLGVFPGGQQAQQDGTPQVTTQQQFDALPPGTEYIGDNGQRFRKP